MDAHTLGQLQGQGHFPSHSQGRLSPILSQSSKRHSYSDILKSCPISTIPFSAIITSDELPPHIPAMMGNHTENTVPGSSSSAFGSDGGGEWLGGEWKREGFGKGLEERLEAILDKEAEGHAPAGLAPLDEPEVETAEVPVTVAAAH
jgi:hypothetical protein